MSIFYFVDVGCEGGISQMYSKLNNTLYVGFEPNNESFKKLKQTKKLEYYNTALWKEITTKTLYIAKKPDLSSLLKPNISVLHNYFNPQRFQIVGTETVNVRSLDDVLTDKRIGFIKLDTQGSEYEILEGAENILKRTLAIEIESEFKELYSGQKLFKDIYNFLIQRGFIFICFKRLITFNQYDPVLNNNYKNVKHKFKLKSSSIKYDLLMKQRSKLIYNLSKPNNKSVLSDLGKIDNIDLKLKNIEEEIGLEKITLHTSKNVIMPNKSLVFGDAIFMRLHDLNPEEEKWLQQIKSLFSIK